MMIKKQESERLLRRLFLLSYHWEGPVSIMEDTQDDQSLPYW